MNKHYRKFRTVGEIEIAKNNPVLTHNAAVKNFTVFTKDGISYLIWNEPNGDESYIPDFDIPAGEYLNGFDLSANIGQELVIEEKHVDGTFDSIDAGDTVTLKAAYLVGTPAVAFTAVEKTVLGEKAVIVRIEAAE